MIKQELLDLYHNDKAMLYKKALFHLRQAGDAQSPEQLLKSYGFDENQIAEIVKVAKQEKPVLFI